VRAQHVMPAFSRYGDISALLDFVLERLFVMFVCRLVVWPKVVAQNCSDASCFEYIHVIISSSFFFSQLFCQDDGPAAATDPAEAAASISHVLRAMGTPVPFAMGTLRLSVGKMTTDEEVCMEALILICA
jgi:hypothetical protein